MSITLALLVATAVLVVYFQLIDWVCWGTRWAHQHVYPAIPDQLWRRQRDRVGEQQMIAWNIGLTTLAAIVIVPLVFIIGPQFANLRSAVLGMLLWVAFALPSIGAHAIALRIPRSMVMLDVVSSGLRIVGGVILATWLFALFRIW